MKDFSDILICSDFDGTLYHGKRLCVSDTDAEAIRYFQEHGGAFTLCTGRFPSVLRDKNITNVTLNAPMICMNGALIYDLKSEKKLFEEIMSVDVTEVILKICEKNEHIEKIFLPIHNNISETNYCSPYETDQIKDFIEQGVYKIVFHIVPEHCDEALERIIALTPEKFALSRSWKTGFEIQQAAASKGLSARKVANMLGRKKLICVGDYENDVSMIKEADIGYAVANACEPLKKIADRITEAKVGGAIAEIIYSL
ncbi:MAG: HAD-IIB family hydrolase [Ruminococcaceae bacterium]|nr:HAD-IIB family hydrolase [Oscillospiraceae bacterium]